ALALLLGGPALADEKDFVSYTATVVQATADVHSGPSEKMYVTNRLSQGNKVNVVGQRDGGWLAIEPPEGSFSWVSERFLQRSQDPRHAVVVTPDGTRAPVLVGSPFVTGKPTVRGTEVRAGTLVWTKWEKMLSEDGDLVK